MEYYIYKGEDELYHYGVKGMRWGVRKTQKWATSEHQPSSVKSSVLAGVYAATGSRRIGRALDKSNNQDAENWARAKKKYTDDSIRKLNRINTKMEKFHSVQSGSGKRVAAGKNTKNPLVKLYSASFVPDQKIASARYAKAKKQVDTILNDLDKRGVTLEKLRERKTGLTAGAGYNFITRWDGVRYETTR